MFLNQGIVCDDTKCRSIKKMKFPFLDLYPAFIMQNIYLNLFI